jgi:Predicted GTPases
MQEEYRGADCPVLGVSARNKEGLDSVRALMRGEDCCCLAGQSGVGKSTLLNALLDLQLETGEISEKIQRGKNTTRYAQLLIHDGIHVLDTAGFSLLETEKGMEPEELQELYPEFQPYIGQCRFQPCLHDREPGCAVTQAVQAGKIDGNRVARYRELLADVRLAWKNRYQ